jgi:hypothetical protein
MTLGRHLRELWQLRKGLVISLCLALLAAGWAVGKVSLFPPGLKMRTLEISAASTTVLVDAPQSSVANLSVNTVDIQAMTNKALLVGNVMGSEPVRSYIMRRAGLPAGTFLEIATPVTPDFPRELSTTGDKKTTDILKSPNEYRLNIQANPTVPVLDLDAEAPTPAAAARIANGAVQGMRDYLHAVAAQDNIPAGRQVTLEQLGTAKGGVVNPGVGVETATLAFLLVFVASAATTLWLARVRKGWNREAARQKPIELRT